MTSSTRIGAQYELAYKDWLELMGMHVSARQAGSKGDFDLVAWGQGCWHVQLKAGRLSCARAGRLRDSLRRETVLPERCGCLVVHRTKEREFCEH